jgi:hypothetical protein
MILDREEEAKR